MGVGELRRHEADGPLCPLDISPASRGDNSSTLRHFPTTRLLIPECSNIQFQFDESPPQSRFVSITFELTEDGTVRQYEIDCALRSWAGNLLDLTGTEIIIDDD